MSHILYFLYTVFNKYILSFNVYEIILINETNLNE